MIAYLCTLQNEYLRSVEKALSLTAIPERQTEEQKDEHEEQIETIAHDFDTRLERLFCDVQISTIPLIQVSDNTLLLTGDINKEFEVFARSQVLTTQEMKHLHMSLRDNEDNALPFVDWRRLQLEVLQSYVSVKPFLEYKEARQDFAFREVKDNHSSGQQRRVTSSQEYEASSEERDISLYETKLPAAFRQSLPDSKRQFLEASFQQQTLDQIHSALDHLEEVKFPFLLFFSFSKTVFSS